MNQKVPKLLGFKTVFLGILILLFSTAGAFAADMPITEDATCWSCHPNYLSITEAYDSFVSIVGGQHPIKAECTACHPTTIKGSAQFVNCTWCHYDNIPQGQSAYLGIDRHRTDGAVAFSNLPNVRHDVYNSHISSSEGCSNCHSKVLTEEHLTRKDRNGNAITCNTCHIGSYLINQNSNIVSTNNSLRIAQNGKIPVSKTWTAPSGTTISSINVQMYINYYHSLKVYGLYNGKWGVVYGPKYGSINEWVTIPPGATAIKTEITSKVTFFSPAYFVDAPSVKLAPSASDYSLVKTAINNKDTSCTACHASAGHKHTVTKFTDAPNNEYCRSCHITDTTTNSTDLVQLHTNLKCESCHENPALQGIIVSNGSLDIPTCATCHNDEVIQLYQRHYK